MKAVLIIAFFIASHACLAQFGVGMHQSNLPFASLSYEIRDRLRPELRIGVDNYLEDIYGEGVVVYDILNKNDYEFYAGVGLKTEPIAGVVVPIGLNFYPLATKKFGFHIELAPILGEEDILRGSWGIRYRFLKDG